MVSEKNGRALTFHIPPEEAHIQSYLVVLRHLLTRTVCPLRRIKIETINRIPAAESPYLEVLRLGFELLLDIKNVILYRRDG